MSTSKKKITRKRLKAGGKRMKGSARPYTRFSSMTTTKLVAAAAGAQVFAKVTSNIGNNATEGDLSRRITNNHATLGLSMAETLAAAIGANPYVLPPGQTIILLGLDGVGWAGDVFVAESTSACNFSTMSF